MHSTQPRVVGQADENHQLMFSISTQITGFHLFQCFSHQNWKQLQSVSRAGRDGDVYDAVCLTGKYFQVKERYSHLSWARYLPSPRQLGFANQIFLIKRQHHSWLPPPTQPWALLPWGKLALTFQPAPSPCCWSPDFLWGFPGILIWLMSHPPFLWSPGGSGLGCSLPRDRFVQPWVEPKPGGVVATGDPLSWSPPSMFCSAAPNPSWCASHIYGLPPTSRLGKAAFPGISIDLPAPGSGCCPG